MLKTALALAAAAAAFAGPAPAQTGAPVVAVVELFTSQGCDACPPADALLAELAERPGVIALALHVDYWDYLGWSDTYGSPAHTARQKAYAKAFGERMIYTPQIVVNGASGVVGSRRDEVEAALQAAPPLTVSVAIAPEGATLKAVASSDGPVEADVVYAVYDPPAAVEITRGENGGRILRSVNPVRAIASLGAWSGGAGEWMLPAPTDAGGVVVLIQRAADRRIIGAARHDAGAVASAAAGR